MSKWSISGATRRLVCFTCAEAETKPAECMSALVDAGLVVYSDDQKRSRLILNAVVRAKVPLAYGIEKTGLTKVGDRCVFALPSGVIEADGKADRSEHRRLARKHSVWPRSPGWKAGGVGIRGSCSC